MDNGSVWHVDEKKQEHQQKWCRNPWHSGDVEPTQSAESVWFLTYKSHFSKVASVKIVVIFLRKTKATLFDGSNMVEMHTI